MKTASATASSPPEISVWAIATAAAAVSARFFGLRPESSAPAPKDLPALKLSIACIHLGISACSPGFGRRCQIRPAISRKRMPNTSLSTLAQVAGSPVSCVAFPPASTSTIVPTIVRPASQPAAKAGPFARARGVPSMRTTAMIGNGLIATPIAIGRMSPIALPISYLPSPVPVEVTPPRAHADEPLSPASTTTVMSSAAIAPTPPGSSRLHGARSTVSSDTGIG